MTIKNIFHKFYFHPVDIIYLIIIILSGMFKEFIIAFILLLVHELGHYTIARHFKWKVSQIKIYPLGGCVKLDEELNRPIKEEFLILIAGPLFQIIFYLFLTFIYQENLISYQNFSIIEKYHNLFLYLNLLPIYPLDGGKLLYLIFQKFLPYQISSKVTCVSSIIFFLLFLYKNFSIAIIFFFSCVIYDIYKFIKDIPYLYQRFLLERYLHNYKFKRLKKISSIKNLYKEYRHLIKEGFKYKTEKECLEKYFLNRR